MPSLRRKTYLFIVLFLAMLVVLFSFAGYMVYQNSLYVDNRNMMTYQGLFIDENQLESELSELPRGGLIAAYQSISELPDYIEQAFDWRNMEGYELYEHALKDSNGEDVYVYALVYPLSDTRGQLYIVSEYQTAIENLMDYEASMLHENATSLMLFVVVAVLVVLGFFWLFYATLLKPIRAMSDWLAYPNEELPYKRIKYQELISVAERHQQGIRAQKAMLDREEFFLSSMSHELRTPIAIISSSVELLQRLELEKRVERVNNRISYAVRNMEYLVKTLLWLSRKHTPTLPETDIRLSALLNQVVRDNEYLLDGRETELTIVMELDNDYRALDNYGAVYLVLVNMVRNALQHSSDGEITITQQGEIIRIINPVSPIGGETSGESYGYGLYLVEKICESRGFAFQFSKDAHQAVGQVGFKSR